MWDDGDHAPLEPDLEQFLAAGPPPIVFTAGSAMMHGRAFFQAATDACRLLKRRGILVAKYPNQTPEDLPPEVRHFRFVPFSRIFPRAAAVVHHGGIGTCAQALAAGVPQLVMPMSHDQPDNAARLERLGVAASIMPKQFTADRVAKRLGELLNRPGIAPRCQALAAKMAAADAVSATCEEIEAMITTRHDDAPHQANSRTLGTMSGAASRSNS
jgi:UDP:flavonoid glycosyltransferase YjiC (YdhE family)